MSQSSSQSQANAASFRLDPPSDGIATLWFDVPGQRMNTLKPGLERELDEVLQKVAQDPAIKGIVFASGKPDSFVAGADIDAIAEVKEAREATRIARALSDSLSRLEALGTRGNKPVVAAIHGPCLGGGLELALACSGRVASDADKTVLGLPEVKLGLIPGGGGTQRLWPLVGVAQAMDLILSGKTTRADKAKKLGLVDDVVAPSILLSVAAERARALAGGRPRRPAPTERLLRTARRATDPAAWQKLLLEDNSLGQRVLFHKARQALEAKTHGHYPAPQRAIDAIERGVRRGQAAGLALEAELFGRLVVSPEARALIGVYQATQALKKDAGTGQAVVQGRPLRRVSVVGGGLMGAGIASVTALAGGLPVRIKEVDDKGVGRAISHVYAELQGQVKRRRRSSREVPRAMSRVTGTSRWDAMGHADVVIEAVFEDLALKQSVLAQIEALGHEDTIFASNTSSIPITQIASKAKRPQNVLGMHYFSPVEKMPLLEIITHPGTSPEAVATCVALGKAQGKTVIVVADGPGFYTTRILTPYLMEAAWLIGEGVAIEDIDRALVRFGFPVGPVTLMDEVGLDTGAKVCKIMHEAMGKRVALPPGLDALLADKRLGRKNGRGFYRYENGKKAGVDASVYEAFGQRGKKLSLPEASIVDRVLLQMVNEAALCLEDKILRTPEDGDIGAIFGLGFPPFLGGIFAYVDKVGAADVVRRLKNLQERHGVRFAPAAILERYAREKRSFRNL